MSAIAADTSEIESQIREIGRKRLRLRYVGPADLAIKRENRGRGFRYLNGRAQPIADTRLLNRIKSLAIPPAWRNVLICKYATGHIQAVGWDAKGRKQYIYHSEWKKIQQQNNFGKMLLFGEMLPRIRKQVDEDMRAPGLQRQRVIATVVWLLEATLVRIGNSEYAETNKSYGLTTLRNRHVQIEKNQVLLEFKGKSGIHHSVEVQNPRVIRTIRQCVELPGYELFQYIDEDGRRRAIDSADVNNHLKTITGSAITAKDFRTWGGTVLAASTLYNIGPFNSEKEAKRNVALAVKTVAAHLRNTSKICRSHYIHPVVLDAYHERTLVPHFEEVYSKRGRELENRSKEEYATWTLLRKFLPGKKGRQSIS